MAANAFVDLQLEAMRVMAVLAVLNPNNMVEHHVVGFSSVFVSTFDLGTETGNRGSKVMDIGKSEVCHNGIVIRGAGFGDGFIHGNSRGTPLVAVHTNCFPSEAS